MKKLFALCFVGLLGFVSVTRAQDLKFEDYFVPVTAEAATPDNDGFIRRWLLLDPISKPNRSNTPFVDSYLRQAFDTLYYKDQKTILPKDGQKVKIGKKDQLVWHALDSKRFNVKLFRFATTREKQRYGVIFHAVTFVYCDEDIENVRLAAGSNSGSMWWLNGEEALILSGDRRMVKDDGVSKRLTLKKGKNVLRVNVINGPGMSDMCVRFIDEAGNPVKNITINTK